MFSNAGRGCVSIEVDLDKLPHESMQLIFQHHCAQIWTLRVYLSDNDTPCNRWDWVAHYFSKPTEWPNLTELWVCSPPDVDFPGLMFQIFGVDSFPCCRQEQDNIVWCAPMHQLTILRLHDIRIDQCLYLLFHCPGLIELHCSSHFAVADSFVFTPKTILSSSRTPKICPNLRVFQWRVPNEEQSQLDPLICIEDWNRFLFSSIRFPNSPGECLWPAEPVESILINKFMPSLSRITALDWDIPTQSCPYLKEVFSRTDMSSLQRLYLLLDVVPEVVPWLKVLTVDQRCTDCFLPRLQIIYIRYTYSRPCATAYDQEDSCLWRMMVKVAPPYRQ